MNFTTRISSIRKRSPILTLAILCSCRGSEVQEPQQPQTAISREKGGAVKPPGRVSVAPPQEGVSAVTVACQSPVELLAIDPQGRRLGEDAQKEYDEIPGGYYENVGIADNDTGAQESDPAKTLFIPNPLPGPYRVSLFGTGNGTYSCQFMGDDRTGGHSETRLDKIPVNLNE